jgi:hypothetical protein
MPSLDTNNALTTLAIAKEFIGSTGTTANDSRINGAINSASNRTNSYTGRKLKRRDYDEIYNGDGSQTLLLNHYPIRAGSSTQLQLYIVGARDSYKSTTDFDSNSQVAFEDIYINSEKGELRIKDNDFAFGSENIRVVYNAGYSTTDAVTSSTHIPSDLQQVVNEMSAFEFEKQRQRAWITRTISHDDGSVSYFDGIAAGAWSVLDTYKDRRG